ncbi:MAG TPA: B-box zinc finger protein [Thermomicrobiales bacterium]|nr:B-box zinc finger protein [Thermomicrobiales bacterium]
MTEAPSFQFSTGEVPCARHPKTLTRLRCSKCGTPICPLCAVRTPVGLRCPDCAGVRGLPTYATPTDSLAKALLVALAIGFAFAALFAWIPQWNFYLSLALGFGVAEAMNWAASGKRGRDLQAIGILICIAAMALGRAILANRLGYTWADVNALPPGVADNLRLNLSPDVIFAGITLLIPWYRFR